MPVGARGWGLTWTSFVRKGAGLGSTCLTVLWPPSPLLLGTGGIPKSSEGCLGTFVENAFGLRYGFVVPALCGLRWP